METCKESLGNEKERVGSLSSSLSFTLVSSDRLEWYIPNVVFKKLRRNRIGGIGWAKSSGRK
jgi:hypothetical protein